MIIASEHTNRGRRLLLPVLVTGLLLALPTAAQDGGDTGELTDDKICNRVDDALFMDQAVPFNRIDVTCSNGIITLAGNVSNILAKQRATRVSETVKGVRSIVNRIEVQPIQTRTANEIRQNIQTALLADAATDSYETNVTVAGNGHVTLTGTAESWQEKRLAGKVARGVKGVTGLTNNINIVYKHERPDMEIRTEVEEALEWNALVDRPLIDVRVDGGAVTLTGTVGSAAEKREARYAAWVTGVDEVDASGLKIKDWAHDKGQRRPANVRRAADDIRQAINDAWLYDPRVEGFDLKAHVSGSVVTVRGKVDNLKAKRAAAQDARNTVGVSRVINRVKVRRLAGETDEEVAQEIRQALWRDPYVDRYEITVTVDDGTAYLSGTVDTYFEKAQADDVAARIAGVTDVSNALIVTSTSAPLASDPYVYDWYAYDYDWYDYTPALAITNDEELREDINSEMWWSPFVDSDEVTVSVEDGIATLTGTVDSWSERRAATENALEGGALKVDNNLNVDVQ